MSSIAQAAKATPKGEAGDRLVPPALAFTAGFVDTCGFIALFGLFTAHVTGNFVLIGAELVGPSQGILTKLLALPTFVVAVALTRLAVAAMEASGRAPLRPLLVAQGVLLLAFMTAGMAISPPKQADAWPELATGLLGVTAMAIQNAKARLLLSSATPSTVMTGNVTQLVIDLVDLARPVTSEVRAQAASRAAKMAPAVAAFAVGAVAGAFGYAGFGFVCLVVPTLVVFALAARVPGR
ncbi:MAG: DUF1275 family protein [Alsobacter sp.]